MISIVELIRDKFALPKKTYLYVIFPLHQAQMKMDEFVNHAAKYGAWLQYADGKDVRIFRMTLSEAMKMPVDKDVHYIGTDDFGYALHKISKEMLNYMLGDSPIWSTFPG